MWSRVYETVRLSVCPVIRPQQWRAAGLLLSVVRVGDIDRQRRAPATCSGGAAARRSAANASSVAFTSRTRRVFIILSQLVRVADLPGRRSLRSARTNRLLVPSVKLVYRRRPAFAVAGPTIWNSLPDNVISAPSLSTFRQRLRTFLFQASFPDIIIDPR